MESRPADAASDEEHMSNISEISWGSEEDEEEGGEGEVMEEDIEVAPRPEEGEKEQEHEQIQDIPRGPLPGQELDHPKEMTIQRAQLDPRNSLEAVKLRFVEEVQLQFFAFVHPSSLSLPQERELAEKHPNLQRFGAAVQQRSGKMARNESPKGPPIIRLQAPNKLWTVKIFQSESSDSLTSSTRGYSTEKLVDDMRKAAAEQLREMELPGVNSIRDSSMPFWLEIAISMSRKLKSAEVTTIMDASLRYVTGQPLKTELSRLLWPLVIIHAPRKAAKDATEAKGGKLQVSMDAGWEETMNLEDHFWKIGYQLVKKGGVIVPPPVLTKSGLREAIALIPRYDLRIQQVFREETHNLIMKTFQVRPQKQQKKFPGSDETGHYKYVFKNCKWFVLKARFYEDSQNLYVDLITWLPGMHFASIWILKGLLGKLGIRMMRKDMHENINEINIVFVRPTSSRVFEIMEMKKTLRKLGFYTGQDTALTGRGSSLRGKEFDTKVLIKWGEGNTRSTRDMGSLILQRFQKVKPENVILIKRIKTVKGQEQCIAGDPPKLAEASESQSEKNNALVKKITELVDQIQDPSVFISGSLNQDKVSTLQFSDLGTSVTISRKHKDSGYVLEVVEWDVHCWHEDVTPKCFLPEQALAWLITHTVAALLEKIKEKPIKIVVNDMVEYPDGESAAVLATLMRTEVLTINSRDGRDSNPSMGYTLKGRRAMVEEKLKQKDLIAKLPPYRETYTEIVSRDGKSSGLVSDEMPAGACIIPGDDQRTL